MSRTTSWSALRIAAVIGLSVVGPTIVPSSAAAQEEKSPVQSLISKGNDFFDELRYEESIQTLSAALLRPEATAEQKISIYRLLAYNYITIERFEEADAAVRGLLVFDEDFALPETESPRFRDYFSKVREAWEAEGKPGLKREGDTPSGPSVRIIHAPPAQIQQGTALKVQGKVEDPEGTVTRVQLFYRSGDTEKFAKKATIYSMGEFRGEVPSNVVKPPLVEYYLLAEDKAGLPLGSRGDADTPLRVAVPDPGSDSIFVSPWFWIPVGVVVVAAVVTTAVLVGGSTDDPSNPSATVRINVGE